MNLKVSIFLVSFRGDLEYAKLCMSSVRKFASGFEDCVLEIPEHDEPFFKPWAERSGFRIATHGGEKPHDPLGGLWQQVNKVYADCYMRDSEGWIFYLDSDCVMTEPFSPSDYFIDGKPILLVEPFESFRKTRNDRYQWKAVESNPYGCGLFLFQAGRSKVVI